MAKAQQDILITAAEAAAGVTDSALEAHSFTLATEDFEFGLPKISCADVVGTSIVILLWEKVAGIWNPVFKDGAAVSLSATNPQESILSYGTYAVSKALATTGTTTVITKAR